MCVCICAYLDVHTCTQYMSRTKHFSSISLGGMGLRKSSEHVETPEISRGRKSPLRLMSKGKRGASGTWWGLGQWKRQPCQNRQPEQRPVGETLHCLLLCFQVACSHCLQVEPSPRASGRASLLPASRSDAACRGQPSRAQSSQGTDSMGWEGRMGQWQIIRALCYLFSRLGMLPPFCR